MENDKNKIAIVSLVLGIAGFVITFGFADYIKGPLIYLGLLMHFIGLVLGIVGLKKSKQKALLIIAIIICAIGIILTSIVIGFLWLWITYSTPEQLQAFPDVPM